MANLTGSFIDRLQPRAESPLTQPIQGEQYAGVTPNNTMETTVRPTGNLPQIGMQQPAAQPDPEAEYYRSIVPKGNVFGVDPDKMDDFDKMFFRQMQQDKMRMSSAEEAGDRRTAGKIFDQMTQQYSPMGYYDAKAAYKKSEAETKNVNPIAMEEFTVRALDALDTYGVDSPEFYDAAQRYEALTGDPSFSSMATSTTGVQQAAPGGEEVEGNIRKFKNQKDIQDALIAERIINAGLGGADTAGRLDTTTLTPEGVEAYRDINEMTEGELLQYLAETEGDDRNAPEGFMNRVRQFLNGLGDNQGIMQYGTPFGGGNDNEYLNDLEAAIQLSEAMGENFEGIDTPAGKARYAKALEEMPWYTKALNAVNPITALTTGSIALSGLGAIQQGGATPEAQAQLDQDIQDVFERYKAKKGLK